MKIFMLFLFVLSFQTLAVESPLTLKSTDKKEWLFLNKDGLRVSADCLKNPCQALKVSKVSTEKMDKIHPAAAYCTLLDGKYEIAKHTDGDEDGICIFIDSSFILAWDLYYLHYPKKVTP